ncbi:hypothetical protein THAOC_12631 [Thalassiosira oceanica]|uniref:Uncharacterized protein n=1 Tax=Thalassiosira oceanica TaxID=159749 RepID=K0SJI7_THAOC|nr:hypothetical protein THAOC_12631 [Thalassiosira oceanica]|eukprot:EJK66453.1 hypothetical protein THAOC_12631 [Thalassiosira oceanica]
MMDWPPSVDGSPASSGRHDTASSSVSPTNPRGVQPVTKGMRNLSVTKGPWGSGFLKNVPPLCCPAASLSLKGTTLHQTTVLSVGSKREDLQSMLEIFLGRKIDAETSICGVEPLLLARSLNWSSRAVCSCLVARAHHSRQTSATYARSSAGPRIHYLDAPQTQPSSARLQRQQAGRGRLKPGVRQNRVTTALGARRLLGLPLRKATVSDCPPRHRTFARTNGRGPSTRQGAQLDEAGQHSSPLCWPGPVSIVAKCAPEGVPSGHEEGEARQLKSAGAANGCRGEEKEKFVTSNAAEESSNL